MKVRIAINLPLVPLGMARLLGKELVSPEDNVGFTMYEFRLMPGDDFSFAAFYPGRCTIQNDANEELLFTADHVLALTPDNKVKADVREPMRIVACSVPRDPSMSPTPLLLKSLSEVVDSDRNIFWERGYSRRFLAAPDGFNLSVHNTLCHSNHSTSLHYQHNVEVVYFIKGQGEYVLQNGEEQHEFDSEKHNGTLILLEHDAHVLKIGAADSIAICLFFPPLKGTENLKFDQESGSSY